MTDLVEEFEHRKSLVKDISFDESNSRLSGFYKWLISQQVTKLLIDQLMDSVDVNNIMEKTGWQKPPQVATPEEVAAIGIFLLSKVNDGNQTFLLTHKYGIVPPYSTSALQDYHNEVMQRFIEPAIDYIGQKIKKLYRTSVDNRMDQYTLINNDIYPSEIAESISRFFKDHPDYNKNAFIMMRFGETKAHESITNSIISTLNNYDIKALRADDKEYHDDLYFNILTYIYGCRFGVAVFERLESDSFNPNVSLEVGYMLALKKPVCFLKDKTLKTLQTDLIGKLYRSFDSQDPQKTISTNLEKWLKDKELN